MPKRHVFEGFGRKGPRYQNGILIPERAEFTFLSGATANGYNRNPEDRARNIPPRWQDENPVMHPLMVNVLA